MRSSRRCSRRWWPSSALLAALLLTPACGGGGRGGSADVPDSGEGAAEEDPERPAEGEGEGEGAGPSLPEIPIEPPAQPEEPQLVDWECLEGWSPRAVEQGKPWAYSICEVGSPPDCEGASLALPGDVLCRPLGRSCEDALSLEGVVIHVDPAAPAGGDGSPDSPLSDLAAALALPNAEGATIRLAAGDHPGAITLDRPVTLQGACASGAVIGPVTVTAAGPVQIGDVAVRPGVPSVLVDAPATDVSLRNVLIEGATDFGLRSRQQGGLLTLERVVIRDTASDNVVGAGSSLFLSSAGRTVVRESVFEDCAGTCIFAGATEEAGAGTLTLERSVVRRTQATFEQHGHLVRLFDGANADLTGVILQGATSMAILIGQGGGHPPPVVTVRDSAVRDIVAGHTDGSNGIGFSNAGRLIIERTVFDRVGGAAVGVSGSPDLLAGVPSADLTDIVVRDSVMDGPTIGGLVVDAAGSLRVKRALFERVGAHVIACLGRDTAEAKLDVEDVVIRDGVGKEVTEYRTLANGDVVQVEAEFATALTVAKAELTGRRIVLANQPRAGVASQGDLDRGARLELTDLTILGGRTVTGEIRGLEDLPAQEIHPLGLSAAGAVDMEVTRVEAQELPGTLVFAIGLPGSGAPELRLSDVHAQDFGEIAGGKSGLAVGVGLGAQLDLARARIDRSVVVAVVASGWDGEPQTQAFLDHVAVDGAAAASCGAIDEGEPGSCVTEGRSEAGGLGLLAVNGGHLSAWNFDVRHAELAGVVVATGGRLELHRGVITQNTIGLNIQAPDQDLALLEDEVYVFDNGTDVARDTLPLPTLPGGF